MKSSVKYAAPRTSLLTPGISREELFRGHHEAMVYIAAIHTLTKRLARTGGSPT